MSATHPIPATFTETSPEPWWKNGHVWLLIAGPATVVVAGFITLALAMHSPDPLVAQDYYRQGIEINRTLEAQRSLAPALQGRNHAMTPDGKLPVPRP